MPLLHYSTINMLNIIVILSDWQVETQLKLISSNSMPRTHLVVDKQDGNAKANKRWFFASRREEIIEDQYYEIKKLESKYRKLYEGSPVMFRTVNSNSMILDCNQAYVVGLGYSNKNEITGHSIFEHAPSDTVQALRDSFEEWRQTGLVNNKEVWLKRRDGSRFPALISANNLYDDDGHLVGSNTVITDMTEIRRARERLEKANEEIGKANEMKEEFVRIAAHELRTPIQPILLTAENAMENYDRAYQQKAWEIVFRQAKRLQQLADDILDVSKIESGNLSYNMKMVRINEIIAEIIDYTKLGVTGRHKDKSITIESRIGDGNGDGNGIELLLDQNRMIQALTNVVNNSLKFTEQGQITVETCILAHKKLFEIKIIDTGAGISEEILPNLFSKFATKTSGKDSDKQGTGLGLFITKRIIQAHGGDIIAYNNSGNGSSSKGERGATFVIRLPIPDAVK